MSSQFGQPKTPQPQINPYASIPGYRTDEPANSAWNRTILAYKSAGVPYSIEKQDTGQTPSKQPSEDRQGLGSVTVSQNVLNKSDALRASMGLPPLENATNVFVTTGPRTTSTNPELEASILGTFEKEPTALKYTGTDKGSYLNALYAKGVLTDLDFTKLNDIVKEYNAKITSQNASARQGNIAARHQQLADITSTLQQAKSAGATSIDIFNAKKEKIGTVNPQNIPQARLQFLQLTRKETSPISLSFNQTSKTVATGVETKLTTPTYKEDPLSLFARGYLGTVTEFGVSFLGQLASDIKAGKITNVSPLEAMLSGKSIVAPDVQSKLAKVDTTFGLSQQIGKTITPKQYSVTQEIASLAGIGTGVTLLTVAGMGGKGKPVSTLTKGNPASFESHIIKITSAFQEKPLEVQTEKIGATRALFQGTEGIPLRETSYTTKPFEYLKPIETQPIIKTGKLPLEKAVAPVPSLAKEIIGIGPKGEQNPTGKFVVPLGKSGTASAEPNLFAAYVSEKQVAFVRSQPSKLPENEFIISGKINPSVKSTLGLKEITGVPDFYIGKVTPGTREYLKQAINANLVSSKQGEIHVQSLEDILTSPKAYTEASRNPDFLLGGKFHNIVRPKVIGYYETYPLPKQTFKPKGGVSRTFKPMKPFGTDVFQTKGGAGSYGKAKALTSVISEPKPVTKGGIKSDLFKTEKPTPRRVNRMRSALEQISSEETTYLQYPKGIFIPSIKTGTAQNISETQIESQRQGISNKFSDMFKTKITPRSKLRTDVFPKITTITTTKQTPITTSITKQTSRLIQRNAQITLPKNIFKEPLNPRTPPPGKKRVPPGFPFGLNPENGPGSPVGGSGATKAFVGNVPEYQFTGMFNRIETRYGKGGAIPRGYKVTSKPASNAFTAFSKASGQNKKSSGRQSKPLSNKFTRLI